MKQILYFMHVDWNWIKQRPHFLAEKLASGFNVDVRYEHGFSHQKRLTTNAKPVGNISVRPIVRLPLNRIALIRKVNGWISRVLLGGSNRKADIIWVPSPMLVRYYKKRAGQRVVYDCMDDMLAFDMKPGYKKELERLERRLIDQADIVIASSDHLRQTLTKRHNIQRDIQVVNNAVFIEERAAQELPPELENLFADTSTRKLVYVGTISKWFDFDLILESLRQVPDAEYLIFGPTEVEIPSHPRIKAMGSVEHKYVHALMQKADALVMPFVVSDLIRSVNPVKAYEYIFAHKPVLMPRYGETEKFEEYIWLYDTPGEYVDLVRGVAQGGTEAKESLSRHQNFAFQNTWDARAKQIEQLLLDVRALKKF